MEFASFFTRPRHAYAVQWDGNEESLRQLNIPYRTNGAGCVFVMVGTSLVGYIEKGFWILKNSAGDFLKPLSEAEFKEKYLKQESCGRIFGYTAENLEKLANQFSLTQSELEGRHIP